LTRSIHFVCSVGEQLPFADGYFDLVISRLALPYMQIPRALAEMARVMKPGGNLWIALHPFSMVWHGLLRSFCKLDLRGFWGGLFVSANGLAFHIAGQLFRFPFGSRSYESFQTRMFGEDALIWLTCWKKCTQLELRLGALMDSSPLPLEPELGTVESFVMD